ncbi:MAG: hypothetical protein ACYTKD_27280 [Planctomycetota bacterium]|jgi:hypothetical protein
MGPRRKKSDPLHDGSAGSYVARFVICFLLGIFADLLILAGMVFILRSDLVIWMLYVVLAVPVVFGVAGVFAFDAVVGIYDKMHDDYMSDR